MRGSLPVDVFDAAIHPAVIFDGEMRVTLTEDGMLMHATDEVRAAWVDVFIPQSQIKFASDDQVSFAFSVPPYRRFCRLAQTPNVDIVFDPDDRRLTLNSANFSYSKRTIIPNSVAEIWRKEPPGQALDVVIDGSALNAVLTLADSIASHTHIGVSCDCNAMYVSAAGKGDSVRVDLPIHSNCDDPSTEFEVEYVLDYLYSIQKIIPDDTTVRLQAGPNQSVCLRYPIGDQGGYVSFTLRARA